MTTVFGRLFLGVMLLGLLSAATRAFVAGACLLLLWGLVARPLQTLGSLAALGLLGMALSNPWPFIALLALAFWCGAGKSQPCS